MHVAIVGPIATTDIGHLLDRSIEGLPPGYAGAPLLATLIAELLARGHKVTALTLSWGMELDWRKSVRASHGNLEVVYVPMRRRAWQFNGGYPGRIIDLYAFERKGLQQAIEQAVPDIVHAHWSYEFAWAAQSSRVPMLLTCHDSPLVVARMYARAKPTQSLYRFLRAAMALHVLRRAKHVTAVSPYLKETVMRLCKSSVHVVPNPLPVCVRGSTTSSKVISEVEAPLLAMVVNGWSKLKNPEPALWAFARLRQRRPRTRLRLYGADFGPGEMAEQWARKNAISAGMEFIGHIPYESLLQEIGQSDILLHPSLEETFGMSIAEAMAQAVPIVGGRRSGAVPWVIGEGGVLADVTSPQAIEDAVVTLLDNPKCYQAASEAARLRATRNFAVEHVVDAYEDLYRNVAAEYGIDLDGSDRPCEDASSHLHIIPHGQ